MGKKTRHSREFTHLSRRHLSFPYVIKAGDFFNIAEMTRTHTVYGRIISFAGAFFFLLLRTSAR